jgi:hypothetical protein
MHGETSTETFKRPRLEGSIPMKTARSPKRPSDSCGPGTYKEALTNIKIAIFRETYPEDKIIENDQNCIMKELGRLFHVTPKGRTTTPEILQTGGRCTYIYAPTNSLVSGSSELLIITCWNQGPG